MMAPHKSVTITFNQVAAFFAKACVSFFEYGSLKAYGVLIQQLTTHSQMSFTETGLILPLQRSIALIIAPLSSLIYSRLGARISVMLGGLLIGIGYTGNGFLPLHPFSLTMCCTCIGLGYGITFISTTSYLKDTFSDEATFGIMTSLTDQFSFVGMMIMPIVFDKFQNLYGSQGALFLVGGLNLNIMVAGVLLRRQFDRRRVRQYRHVDDHLSIQEHPKRDVDNTDRGIGKLNLLRPFWVILVENPCICFLYITSFFHFFNIIAWALFLVSLGQESGLSQSEAVLLTSCGGFGALFGRVWSIILFSLKVENPFQFFGIPALVQFASLTGIAFTKNNFVLSMVMSFVSGIAFGAIGAGCTGMCAMKTRRDDFRHALVMLYISLAIGNEVGGGLSGSVYDIFGSSRGVFLEMAAVSLLMALVSTSWTIWENKGRA